MLSVPVPQPRSRQRPTGNGEGSSTRATRSAGGLDRRQTVSPRRYASQYTTRYQRRRSPSRRRMSRRLASRPDTATTQNAGFRRKPTVHSGCSSGLVELVAAPEGFGELVAADECGFGVVAVDSTHTGDLFLGFRLPA
jgi:hypothetical protein